jgi:hypothetical protein
VQARVEWIMERYHAPVKGYHLSRGGAGKGDKGTDTRIGLIPQSNWCTSASNLEAKDRFTWHTCIVGGFL